MSNNYIIHYGVKGRSGRYKLGSKFNEHPASFYDNFKINNRGKALLLQRKEILNKYQKQFGKDKTVNLKLNQSYATANFNTGKKIIAYEYKNMLDKKSTSLKQAPNGLQNKPQNAHDLFFSEDGKKYLTQTDPNNNCAYIAQAAVLRRMGYDVAPSMNVYSAVTNDEESNKDILDALSDEQKMKEARKNIEGSGLYLKNELEAFGKTKKDVKTIKLSSEDDPEVLRMKVYLNMEKNEKDGSFGIINIPGHAMYWEKQNGKVTILDGYSTKYGENQNYVNRNYEALSLLMGGNKVEYFRCDDVKKIDWAKARQYVYYNS